MGSHTTITSLVFQSRISPRGQELCQDADSWFSRAVTQQQLLLAAHTAEELPAGPESRHSCHGHLGEHGTFQGRKISETILGSPFLRGWQRLEDGVLWLSAWPLCWAFTEGMAGEHGP